LPICSVTSRVAFRRLHCERFHFAGDDGETPAGLAGSRRFDRRIQRQEVRLRRDLRNQADDRTHFFRCVGKRSDRLIGLVRARYRLFSNLCSVQGLRADVSERRTQLLDRRRYGGSVHRCIKRCFGRGA
jgi:hypothetical protein